MADNISEIFSGTGDTPEHLRFDEQRLASYLKEQIPNFGTIKTVKKFKGGQSNPTYLITTSHHHYVLRRKPPGDLLPSAHAVEREYRIMTALGDEGIPVPQTFILCEDADIIGTPFFVMDFVEGRIFWDAQLQNCSADERKAIYFETIDVLAKLHAVDPVPAGLDDYGKQGGYFDRQIKRWSRQYQDSETRKIEMMDKLIDWLPHNIPSRDETTIVHGDYRLDNLIIHPEEPKIIAILDWELSTLGHPLADLTYYLMTWNFPKDVRGGLAGLDLGALNIPTLDAMAARYSEKSGRHNVLQDLDFCMAYNIFRLAAIAQGVYKRGLQGNASSEQSLKIEGQIPALAGLGWFYATRAGATG